MSGWVKLHREILESEVFDDHNAYRVFTVLMAKCAYIPQVNKRYGYTLEAGECDLTIRQIAEIAFKNDPDSYEKTRRALERLVRYSTLTSRAIPANRRKAWKLVNWRLYQGQDEDDATRTPDSAPKSRHKNATSAPTLKEIKKLRTLSLECESAFSQSTLEHDASEPAESPADPEAFLACWPDWALTEPDTIARLFLAMPDVEREHALTVLPDYVALLERVPEHQRRYVSARKWLEAGKYKASPEAWKVDLRLTEAPPERMQHWGEEPEEYEFTPAQVQAWRDWCALSREQREAAMTASWEGSEQWRSDIDSEQVVDCALSKHQLHAKRNSIPKLLRLVAATV